MIISRTPFRISFVGGGTDLRSFYSKEPGQVLSVAIDKYIYVVAKRQLGIVEFKYRINWSKTEFRNRIEEIEHPIVRETLKLLHIDFPVEITTFADIPAQTGLGSSSAFAVGLLHALLALKGERATKFELASRAGEIEVDVLGRVMGKQDHFASAYGNLNVFTFHTDGKVSAEPVFYSPETYHALQDNLLLFYTGLKRDAGQVLKAQNDDESRRRNTLRAMKNLVPELRKIVEEGYHLDRFGSLLDRGWQLKRKVSKEITSEEIDGIYERAKEAGALGGKLLGAGGGGFFLFYVETQNREKVVRSLSGLYHVPFTFDESGTGITYYDQSKFF